MDEEFTIKWDDEEEGKADSEDDEPPIEMKAPAADETAKELEKDGNLLHFYTSKY